MSGTVGDGESSKDPLEALDPLHRFSDRAADYVRHRPDYPAAAIDCILEGLASPEALLAADVGAGTGISARQLADRGVRVIAVEPNAVMRLAAAPHPRVTWREGAAEASGLEAASVDLVLCAQAFHWFRGPQALAEFHRILKPRGRLVLMWNRRDRDDPLTRAYIEAIHEVNGESEVERMAPDLSALPRSGLFTVPRPARFPHAQRLDREGLIGRATSASYVPKEGERFERLKRRLEETFERHREPDGHVTLRYVTDVLESERV